MKILIPILLYLGLITIAQAEKTLIAMPVFAVSPAKQEIRIAAGDSLIRNIYISNNLGRDAVFTIDLEDVSGSENVNEIVRYYGEGTGPYSIKKFAMVGTDQIKVSNGEVKVVPIMISVPVKTKPGGYYGALMVKENRLGNSNTKVSTRAGSLIFLRVEGETLEKGEVKDFKISNGNFLFGRKPIDFQITFSNSGNVYLNPYGLIEIKNFRGQVVNSVPIDPWFVYPDSVRTRGIVMEKVPWFGFFTATLYLNHGYTSPHATVLSRRILVFPLGIMIGIFALAILAAIAYRLRFKIKKWQI